jgi:DNA invertase Pin-like site-specific DNA recombinase
MFGVILTAPKYAPLGLNSVSKLRFGGHDADPCRQYLRISTEHQQYSLKNQSVAIERYAGDHDAVIVRTYSDAARSGLVLNRRMGLRQLLQDVISGDADYKMILVYDVSRWGRFQDIDESGHYEFICRSAGVPVHYVAEPFQNDGTLPSMIRKALKRIMMAGEYSRELSVKVYEGAKRLASMGFKQGGVAGFGFRRLLISPAGDPKQELAPGERKSIQQDRVVLTPGPEYECYWVREIFRMYTQDRKLPLHIANELNAEGVRYTGIIRRQWYPQAVNRILRNPKYAGTCVYGRYSQRLRTPRVRMPNPTWTIMRNAWTPIVDQATSDLAQQRFANQTWFKSDERS